MHRAILTLLVGAQLVTACARVAEADPPAPDRATPLRYVILVTGGELLEGTYADAHTPFLTRTLSPLGCQCVGATLVDDNRQDIVDALHGATNRAPLIIVTGGLGPTPNDITRETLSEFTGIPLQEHPEALAELERRFHQPREQLRANLRRQTLAPTRGGILENPHGTAVGLVFEAGPAIIVALPGPPRELRPMVQDRLVPLLQRRFRIHPVGTTLTLRFIGLGQSQIDQVIKDQVKPDPDIHITSLFEGGRVDFTFALPGQDLADRERLQALADRVALHLGDNLYARDGSTLEEAVLRRLPTRSHRIVLVEIATGGRLAAAVTGPADASHLQVIAYVASSRAEAHRMLGQPASETDSAAVVPVPDPGLTLLQAAAARTEPAWIVVVDEPRRDPAGSLVVGLILQDPAGRRVTNALSLRDPSEGGRANLVNQVLDSWRQFAR